MSEGPRKADESAEAKERAAELIGRTISDRYRIVELIAMGGMGAVYRGEHVMMHKSIALKVLHPQVEGFPELVARFEREAVAGAHIQHPNVAVASDFGKFDGESRFLVLEHIQGRTLRELIEEGPMDPERACRIVRQAASGLAAVHAKGIVHRDVKPKNIMIVDEAEEPQGRSSIYVGDPGDSDVVKLIDFGFAKVPVEELSALAQDADSARTELTRAGMVVGTMGYLAPEAALGTGAISNKSDIYALGVIFFEMLTKKPPYEGPTPVDIFTKHRMSPLPKLAERNPEVSVPDSVEKVLRKMLEKDPSDRYASADDLVDDLTEVINAFHEPVKPKRPPPPPPPKPKQAAPVAVKSTRRNIELIGGLALAAVLLVIAAYLAMNQEKPTVAETGLPQIEVEVPEPKPTASASAEPAKPPSALERLRAAADAESPEAALDLLTTLATSEPEDFGDRAMQSEAAAVIETAAAKGIATQKIFNLLTTQLGSDGIDILYDLIVREQRATEPLVAPGQEATSAGAKARALLARTEIQLKGTPALRAAFELQRASCQHRVNLFPKAAEEGDDRALEILRSMQPPACAPTDACCYDGNKQLERAIADIQKRLRD